MLQTDLALLLHCTSYFKSLWMKEIWQLYGTGEALHASFASSSFCTWSTSETVIKVHILTGDDYLSKMGTKHAVMTSDPEQYLTNFGEADTLSEQGTALAEKHLVRVWAGARSTTTAEMFDDLTVESYACACRTV